ncbi:MAG: isopentenyl phosphate kinase [Anaerolineae bacterium]
MAFVFLKLGGSAITDKTREAMPRPDIIRRAAREVQRARANHPDLRLLIGHGSGSFGHFAAKRSGYGLPSAWKAYAETGAAANRLNRIVADILLTEGVPVLSLQPSASARCRDGELLSLEVAHIRAALEHDLVPLIYGDVALDETREMSIASTEKLFAYLAPLLQPDRLVYVSQVDGVYTADPSRSPGAGRISEITPAAFAAIEAGVGGSHGVDVTGGMLDKVRRNLALVQQLPHLDVYIIGSREGMIERALGNESLTEGTHIHAA